MQGRAAAVYGLVLLLVATAASAYVVTADTPEPTMQEPEWTPASGEEFPVENDQGDTRTYRVGEFGVQNGQPTVTLVWVDEEAESSEEWEFAEDPDGTTIVYEDTEYYVREDEPPATFELLEAPPEDGNVSLLVDDGNWIVSDGENYVPLEEYEGLERITVENGTSFEEGEGEESREVTVEVVTNESVTISWIDPQENEQLIRQTDREELNGVNVTAHFPPGEDRVHITSDEAEIERYVAAHEDRAHFQQRVDGLIATAVLSLVAVALLLGLAFLPRKE